MSEAREEKNNHLMVAIGFSAGGLRELISICRRLPSDFDGKIVAAMHRQVDSPAERLQQVLRHELRLPVAVVAEGDSLCCATLHIGRSAESMTVDGDHVRSHRDTSQAARLSRIDDLFTSIAEDYGSDAVGVILSGSLDDGVDGLEAIQKAGGRCLIQSPDSASFADMPINSLQRIEPDFVGNAEEIAEELTSYARFYSC